MNCIVKNTTKQTAEFSGKPFICSALAVPVDGAYYGAGTGAFRVLLSGIKCNGTESNVGLCEKGLWGINSCDHGDDAGLLCIGMICIS